MAHDSLEDLFADDDQIRATLRARAAGVTVVPASAPVAEESEVAEVSNEADAADVVRLVIAEITADIDAVYDAACITVTDKRWSAAIDKAWSWLHNQRTVLYRASDHTLYVPSATAPGLIYTANGACQCQAYAAHNACWHRAAARLVRRALEAQIVRERGAREALATELASLADQLFTEAQDCGDDWFTWQDAMIAAKIQYTAILDYADAWDAQAA